MNSRVSVHSVQLQNVFPGVRAILNKMHWFDVYHKCCWRVFFVFVFSSPFVVLYLNARRCFERGNIQGHIEREE